MPRPRPSWVHHLEPTPSGASQGQILDVLRAVIVAGWAAPGSPIPVDDVADRFGVSRIPVREALKTLQSEGLVDHQPRAGYTVAQLSREELREYYLVREALEASALRVSVERATAADDAEVLAAHAALSQAIEDQDSAAYHRESRRFHFGLIVPSRMHRLLHVFQTAWNVTEPAQPMAHVPRPQSERLQADHQLMLDAFLARDADRLLAAAAAHYRQLEQVVAELPPGRLAAR